LVNRMNNELMRHYGPHGGQVSADRQFWENTPAFSYRAPTLDDVIAGITVPLLLLLAWCGVAGLAAWFAVREVRP